MGNTTIGLKGASDGDPLLEVDTRGRISLGKLAEHRRYLATRQDGGQILLTPVIILPATDPLTAQIEQQLEQRAASRPTKGDHIE